MLTLLSISEFWEKIAFFVSSRFSGLKSFVCTPWTSTGKILGDILASAVKTAGIQSLFSSS